MRAAISWASAAFVANYRTEKLAFDHDEIVADVRTLWEPTWQDRGLRSAYFGEVNPDHNDEMPSVLLEVAFHDNATDAQFLPVRPPVTAAYLEAEGLSPAFVEYMGRWKGFVAD